ncbi:hypothetical protein C0995_005331 [Termitomyces sp. Mi166|nr:hypothetical protein C0995_005331 [Termitomyces sp. Mi166\
MATTEPDAFRRALQVYTQHLTAEERARIQAPTSLSDLVAQAKRVGDALDQSRKTSSLQTFGEKALLLEPFEKLMEGACKMSPRAGELIWGSVSFVLQMAKNNVKVFDEVLDFFERMAEEVGHIRIQENTFSASPLVQSVVEALYVAILKFWVEAVKYYRLRLGGLRARFKTFVLSSSIDKKFQGLRDAIVEGKTRLHEASSAQHNADSAFFNDQNNLFHRSARQKELKNWLNAPDYEQDFYVADEVRYQGTCEWIQRKQSYIDWSTSISTSFLFIHGIPGAGKTILSSRIISNARSRSQTTSNQLLLYHYFKDSDTDKRTPVSALRSFIDQLFNEFRRTNKPLLSDLESRMEAASLERSRHASYTDFWNIFSATILDFAQATESSNLGTITIVMDAMDECQSPSTLVSDFLNLAHQCRGKVKVLMTGRKSAWDLVRQSLYMFPIPIVNLEITLEDVQQDIQTFVRHTICSIPRLSNHKRLRDRLSDEIGRADNHQGMFLWAFFMCEEVKRQGDTQALHKLLDHLPKGLDAMYGRICHSIIEKDDGVGFSLLVLRWIVHSPRPLQFSELQEGLRLMRPRIDNDTLARNAWFDQSSDLLWSRQDIVDACGNLVTYAGPSNGDTFTLVHLSANQFFQIHSIQSSGSEALRSFLEDIRHAELTLGTLCLRYLLGDALRSDGYLMPSATFIRKSPSEEANFMERYPLFNFAVIHWPGLILNGLCTGHTNSAVDSLISTIASFISDRIVITWLVHAINLLSIEVTIDTLEQLAGIDGGYDLIVMTEWASETINMLTTYRQALTALPELIWKCLPIRTLSRTCQIVHEAVGTTAVTPQILSVSRAWVHYDPTVDVLLFLEGNRICLRGQFMKTGCPAMRPGLVPRDLGVPSSLACCAAAISHSGQFIAAMYDTFHSGDSSHVQDGITIYQTGKMSLHPVFLVCWRLSSFGISSSGSGSHSQPNLVLFEKYDASWYGLRTCASQPNRPPVMGDGANIISFIDDMLVTPRGVWDINRREWLDGPPTIYQPMPELNMVCFSSSGKRAARINAVDSDDSAQIEFFDTQSGTSLCKARFTDTKRLLPLAFSHSGQMIAIYNYLSPVSNVATSEHWCSASGQLLCFSLDDERTVKLDTPYPICVHSRFAGVNAWQFLHDEETLVADVKPCTGHFESGIIFEGPLGGIAVWNLSKDNNGHYVSPAPMKYLHKTWDYRYKFCTVPGLHLEAESDMEVLIVSDDGIVTRRSVNSTWLTDEERELLAQNPTNTSTIVQLNEKEKVFSFKTLSMAHDGATSASFVKWSFQSMQLCHIAREECILDVAFDAIKWRSPTGNYFLADGRLFHAFTPDSVLSQDESNPIILPIKKQDIIVSIAFSADDERVAILHHNDEYSVMLTVIDIHKESVSSQFTAKITNESDLGTSGSWKFHLDLNQANPSQFLISISVVGTKKLGMLRAYLGIRTFLLELMKNGQYTP